MDFVAKNIAIGNHADVDDVDRLVLQDVGAVLNVADNMDVRWDIDREHKFGIRYAKVGLVDDGGNSVQLAIAAIYVLLDMLGSRHTVMVCCQGGRSRSAGVVAATLTWIHDTEWEWVVRELKKRRPSIEIHPGIESTMIEAVLHLARLRALQTPGETAPEKREGSGAKYQPAYGSEGMDFEYNWCQRCKKDEGWNRDMDPEKACMIHNRALVFDVDDQEYPAEWTYGEDGQPKCTAFEEMDGDEVPQEDPDDAE